jgi:hypothetical protein
MGGLVELGPDDSIATRILRLSSRADLADSPKRFLLALRGELHSHLARLLAEDHSRFQWILADTEVLFTAFFLRRNRAGMVDLLELKFPLCESKGKPALGDPEIVPHMAGVFPRGPFVYSQFPTPEMATDLADLLIPVDPDAEDETVLADIDKAVDGMRGASELLRAETTATVDVAVIEAKGARWLRKRTAAPTAAEPW